jgi:transposase
MTRTLSKLTREQLEERRLEGGRCLHAETLYQAEIARHLNVSRVAWVLGTRSSSKTISTACATEKDAGSSSKLSKAQKQGLKRLLDRGALACGCATDCWTMSRVADLIEREFDVTYHPNYLSRLLASLSFSLQKPLPQAVEQDEALVRAWLQQD